MKILQIFGKNPQHLHVAIRTDCLLDVMWAVPYMSKTKDEHQRIVMTCNCATTQILFETVAVELQNVVERV